MSIELTAPQRLKQFLATLRRVHKHNGPITPALLKELQEIVKAYRDGGRHD